MKLKGYLFIFFFCRGDNDEEEPPKLKVEHHDISVTGLQSPGKLFCKVNLEENSLHVS